MRLGPLDTDRPCEQLFDGKPCSGTAERRAFTPWGQVKYVCLHCASAMGVAGILIRPLVDPYPGHDRRCWCGSLAGKPVMVEGLWYFLCDVHQPPRLWDLWARLWVRIGYRLKRIFVRPKELSAADTQALIEAARRRAKAEGAK